MNVADAFPARQQPDGRVYFLTEDRHGWTYNPALAHPDYAVTIGSDGSAVTWRGDPWAPAPLPQKPENVSEAATGPPAVHNHDEETAVTAIDDTGAFMPRTTEWCRFPLPPRTPRPASKFGTWGWYQLPDPDTGRPTGYPRATTIAKTLDDTFGLHKWERRETAKRVFQLAMMEPGTVLHPNWPDLTAAAALDQIADALSAPTITPLDNTLDVIDNLMGAAEARELGECVHAWLEALDMGIVLLRDVPDVVRPHVENARRVIAHRGLVMPPEFVERTVLNDQVPDGEVVAGKLDRIGRLVTSDELVLVDVKTSKELKYSWLSFGVQVGGVYGWATKMLAVDGKSWEPMPDIRKDFAILLHVPSNQPNKAAAITIDMGWGGEVYAESLAVRARQKEAKVVVPRHAVPTPSAHAIRYAEARLALTAITTADEGNAVYESYQDVWDDDLGEFATTVAELV